MIPKDEIFEDGEATSQGEIEANAINAEGKNGPPVNWPLPPGCSGKYHDDMTGQPLADQLVLEARQKELEYFHLKNVWLKRPRAEAKQRTGKPAISVRWVDVNKGDDESPNYRSRLVARQLKAHDRSGESFFAPTPPLEALRLVLSRAATDFGDGKRVCRDPTSENRTQISFVDVARAYFNAVTDPDDPTYVELPPEDRDSGGDQVALLLRHMYGTRKAADGWQEAYSSFLVSELGFQQGMASPCVFVHNDRNLTCSVHGDDFTTSGPKRSLDWLEKRLGEQYEIKIGPRLGPGPNDAKEATVLNRIVRWTEDGLEYEADPRQAEKLLRECGLEGASAVATPGVRPSAEQLSADKDLITGLHTAFRGSAARGNYLANDRPDCQFAAKEICRWMSSPTDLSWQAMKRMARYLAGHPRLVVKYPWQQADTVDIYSDTDWAGCPRTRKSTSGGCVMVGSHLLKSWSSTQASVALSSGEAEFYGVLRAAGVGLGFQSLMKDLSIPVKVRVWTDSSAAIGICARQGLGKLRHIDTHTLWVQQAVRCKRFTLHKVLGESNPADVFTKHMCTKERLGSMMELLGCEYRHGRAEAAPQMRQATTSQKTMADINDEDAINNLMSWTCLPHLMDRNTVEKHFPAINPPAEANDKDHYNNDDDPMWARGAALGEEIMRYAAKAGRLHSNHNHHATQQNNSLPLHDPTAGPSPTG
jgi:hypothetical protein